MAYTRPLYYTSPVMVGNDVKEVQTRLSQLGFYTSTIDGSFGPGTKTAVIKFQADAGLSQDGSCGPATWDRMFYLNLTNPQKHGSDVRKMQQRLKDLGYNPGTVDGWFGQNSYNAITQFQSNNSLTKDGSCGPTTWTKLFSSSAISVSTAINILKTAGSGGMFLGGGVNFTAFDVSTPITFASLSPIITLQAKVSANSYLGVGGKVLDLSMSNLKNVSITATNNLTNVGLNLDLKSEMLISTFVKANLKIGANERLTYKIESIPNVSTKFIMEHQRIENNIKYYIISTITIYNNTDHFKPTRVPVYSTSSSAVKSNGRDIIATLALAYIFAFVGYTFLPMAIGKYGVKILQLVW